jgi:hypothetical protein
MVSTIQSLGTLALFLTALGFFTFCALFHVLADWRATEMGKHMMTFMLVCTCISSYAFFATAFWSPSIPVHLGKSLVRLIMYGSLGTVVWWRVRILVRMQIQARREQGVSTKI